MRVSSLLALSVLVAGALSTVAADAASQHRYRHRAPLDSPLIVQVPPRSFLDPGPAVPVGSLSKYVYASQYHYSWPYSYTNHYGHPPLPRCGVESEHMYQCPSSIVPFANGLDFGPLSGP
ncbi:MAG: hypothetical protein JO216_10540 [Hyphomicrobiales bacterium]|nr:hypothetical protein [Hyphomicrobiales bacterium]